MHNRRTFLKAAGAGSISLTGCLHKPRKAGPLWINDAHSQLNRTRIAGITRPENPEPIQQLLRRDHTISICGGRHAMGGQQFGTDNQLVDTGSLNKVLQFDRKNGLLEVEAGIQWPD
ncbi:MAG: FAD-binding protein, partial [Opitutae bacterium]|nr:FAD-binding protein [Opitutae bacterium]